jgi:hypothetical protein
MRSDLQIVECLQPNAVDPSRPTRRRASHHRERNRSASIAVADAVPMHDGDRRSPGRRSTELLYRPMQLSASSQRHDCKSLEAATISARLQ